MANIRKLFQRVLDSTDLDEKLRQRFQSTAPANEARKKALYRIVQPIQQAGSAFLQSATQAPRELGKAYNQQLYQPFEIKRVGRDIQTDKLLQDINLRRGNQKRADFYEARSVQSAKDLSKRIGENPQKRNSALVRTALTVGGLTGSPATLAGSMALGGALGGVSNALQKKNIAEGVGQGAGESIKFAGLNRITNPVLTRIEKPVSQNIPLRLAKPVVQGLGNLAEDIGYTKATENRNLTRSEGLQSLALGAGFSMVDDFLKRGAEVDSDGYIKNSAGRWYDPRNGQWVKSLTGDVKKAQDSVFIGYSQFENLPNKADFVEVAPGKFTRKNMAGFIRISKGNDDPILKEAKKQIGEDTRRPTIKETWKELYTDWVNRFQPIEDLRDQVIKVKSSILDDPKIALTRFLGAGGTAELRQKKQLDPILKQLEESQVSKDDFDVFLKAQRDIELAGREIYGSDPDQADAVLQSLGRKYDINTLGAIADQLYAYQRKGLESLRDAGFLSEDGYQKIIASNEKYVPFDRVMDDVSGYIGLPATSVQQGSQPVQKIKGSKRNIYSPIESIIANTYKVEAAVAKNRVAKSIIGLREVLPDLKSAIIPVAKSGPNTISVWEGGAKQYYAVPDDVSRAVKGLNEEQSNLILDILSAPARVLRQQATGRNIDFMVPNAFRDQFEAAFNSKYGYRPFLDYFNGLRHWVNFKYGSGDDLVEEWMNAGGYMFFENMGGRRSIRQQLSEAEGKRVTKRLADWLIGGIDTLGDISEKPTRIGLYKRARQAGANQFEAAMESREGTLDFARMGAKMKTANSLIPFLNVGVQGFDRMVRTVKEKPGVAALKIATYAGLPALATSVYNNLYHGEDYAQVPDFEKQGNFIIMTGGYDTDGKATYIKIPKPHWAEFIATPTENFVTWMAGNNPQTFTQMALNVIGEGLPIVAGGDTLKEAVGQTIGQNLPQAIKVPVEQVANYDFFRQSNIVPQYMTKKPPEEQVYKTTPGAYRYIGKVLNTSPLRVKHALEGTVPALSKQPVNLYETVKTGGEDINKIPVARRFFGSYSGFDTERPETTKGPGILTRISPNIDQASASTGEQYTLPSDIKDLTQLYKGAMSDIESYRKFKVEYQAGMRKEDELAAKQAKVDEAIALKKQIEKQQPEQVFNIQLKTYASGSGASVEERADWAVQQLNRKAGNEEGIQDLINRMWEEKVFTTGSNGVAQYILDTYGINVSRYTGSNKKIKVGSSGSKAKKGPAISIKNTPKVTPIQFSQFKLPTISLPSSGIGSSPKLQKYQPKKNIRIVSSPREIDTNIKQNLPIRVQFGKV